MPEKMVSVVLPRWMALAPLLFSVVMVLVIVYMFRNERPSRFQAVRRFFTVVYGSASLIGCFFLAYGISRGRPIQTSSKEIISWGTVVQPPKDHVPAASPASP